ncbi:MAG: DNA repair exonuclease [candidate division WOR-3 bacterium]|nr:MAG: DNA repair exonuclease [candidate division WOR-3 bacterium]
MKFIHTADLHLKKGEEGRLETLGWLVKKADELGADYFLIAGDLFDSDTDGTLLRKDVRRICDAARCRFIIIPGNHDAASFGSGCDYGKNVVQLIQKPFHCLEIDSLKICGIPYQEARFSECIKELPGGIDILLAHGTVYDQSYIYSLLSDQETEYMPIFPVDLQNVARYVAMGHIHAHSVMLHYEGTQVVYPGSPIALDTKCEGERSFRLVEVNTGSIDLQEHVVENAPYYLNKKFFVYPQAEASVLEAIEEFLRSIGDPRVMPRVVVQGYIAEKENDYLEALSAVRLKHETRFPYLRFDPEIQSWDTVLANPMVRNFVAKTADLDDDLRMKIFEICLPVFSKVLK